MKEKRIPSQQLTDPLTNPPTLLSTDLSTFRPIDPLTHRGPSEPSTHRAPCPSLLIRRNVDLQYFNGCQLTKDIQKETSSGHCSHNTRAHITSLCCIFCCLCCCFLCYFRHCFLRLLLLAPVILSPHGQEPQRSLSKVHHDHQLHCHK